MMVTREYSSFSFLLCPQSLPYPSRLCHYQDFRLILSEAYDISVAMPTTAVAQQMYAAAMAKGMDEDFSIMIKFMEEIANLSTSAEK